MVVVALLFGTLLVVFIATLYSAAESGRLGKLDRIARELQGQRLANQAQGTYGGIPVLYTLGSRGTSSNWEAWTEVDVAIPPAYPLAIHVRRHRPRDQSLIARGDMIDVQVGDPKFDPLFLVEAAPADVVRILLDPETRGYLASHGEVELDTFTERDGSGKLRLAIRGWYEELPDAMAAIAALVRLTSRVREAFAIAEQATQPVDGGSPYRPMLDDTPVREAADARKRELVDLAAARARRSQSSAAVVFVIVLLFAVLMLAASAGH